MMRESYESLRVSTCARRSSCEVLSLQSRKLAREGTFIRDSNSTSADA